MPRTARLYYPGGIFHIISRFTRREFLMCDDAHRNRYLMLLSETLKRTDALLLAWCLMSSHIHLVVKSGITTVQNIGICNNLLLNSLDFFVIPAHAGI